MGDALAAETGTGKRTRTGAEVEVGVEAEDADTDQLLAAIGQSLVDLDGVVRNGRARRVQSDTARPRASNKHHHHQKRVHSFAAPDAGADDSLNCSRRVVSPISERSRLLLTFRRPPPPPPPPPLPPPPPPPAPANYSKVMKTYVTSVPIRSLPIAGPGPGRRTHSKKRIAGAGNLGGLLQRPPPAAIASDADASKRVAAGKTSRKPNGHELEARAYGYQRPRVENETKRCEFDVGDVPQETTSAPAPAAGPDAIRSRDSRRKPFWMTCFSMPKIPVRPTAPPRSSGHSNMTKSDSDARLKKRASANASASANANASASVNAAPKSTAPVANGRIFESTTSNSNSNSTSSSVKQRESGTQRRPRLAALRDVTASGSLRRPIQSQARSHTSATTSASVTVTPAVAPAPTPTPVLTPKGTRPATESTSRRSLNVAARQVSSAKTGMDSNHDGWHSYVWQPQSQLQSQTHNQSRSSVASVSLTPGPVPAADRGRSQVASHDYVPMQPPASVSVSSYIAPPTPFKNAPLPAPALFYMSDGHGPPIYLPAPVVGPPLPEPRRSSSNQQAACDCVCSSGVTNPLLLEPTQTQVAYRRQQPVDERSTPELPDLAAFGEPPHVGTHANPVKNIIAQLENMIASYDTYDSVFPLPLPLPLPVPLSLAMPASPRSPNRGKSSASSSPRSKQPVRSPAAPYLADAAGSTRAPVELNPLSQSVVSQARVMLGPHPHPPHHNDQSSKSPQSQSSLPNAHHRTLDRALSVSPNKPVSPYYSHSDNIAPNSSFNQQETYKLPRSSEGHSSVLSVLLDEQNAISNASSVPASYDASAANSVSLRMKEPGSMSHAGYGNGNGSGNYSPEKDRASVNDRASTLNRSVKLINMPPAPNAIITMLRSARENGPRTTSTMNPMASTTAADEADKAMRALSQTIGQSLSQLAAKRDVGNVGGGSCSASVPASASSYANASAFSSAALEIERLLDEMNNVTVSVGQQPFAPSLDTKTKAKTNSLPAAYRIAGNVTPSATAGTATGTGTGSGSAMLNPKRIDEFEPGKGCSINEAEEVRYRNRLRIAQTQGTQTDVLETISSHSINGNGNGNGNAVASLSSFESSKKKTDEERRIVSAGGSLARNQSMGSGSRSKRKSNVRSTGTSATATASMSASAPTSPARRSTGEPATREEYVRVAQGGEIPLLGLRRPFPDRAELPYQSKTLAKLSEPEVELSPVQRESLITRSREEKDAADAKRRLYVERLLQEERMKKSEQERMLEQARRHTDHFVHKNKSPVPLDRFDSMTMPMTMDSFVNQRQVASPSLMQQMQVQTPHVPSPPGRQTRTKIRGRARALYAFRAQNPHEQDLEPGDFVYLVRRIDNNWFECELPNGARGIVPANHLEILTTVDAAKQNAQQSEGAARAKFDFQAESRFELSFSKGALLTVIRQVDENWFEGRLGSQQGLFPISYVDLLEMPRTPNYTPLSTPSSTRANTPVHQRSPSDVSDPRSSPMLMSNGRHPSALLRPANHEDSADFMLPDVYRVVHGYKPRNEQEIDLMVGDTVYVQRRRDDGWFIGRSARSGRVGAFPGTHVELIV